MSTMLTDTTIRSAADAVSRGLTTGIPRVAGKGLRLIMVGMGSQEGWLEGSVQLWKRSPKEQGEVLPEDYHADINAEGFTKWSQPVRSKKITVTLFFFVFLS